MNSKKIVRQIESFEFEKDYYINSFNAGNKSHVAEELSELMLCNTHLFILELIKMPKEMQRFILESNYYKDASLYLLVNSNIKRF